MADKEYTLEEIQAMANAAPATSLAPDKGVVTGLNVKPDDATQTFNAPQSFFKGVEHGATAGFGDRISAGVDYLTSKIPGVRSVAQAFNKVGGSGGGLPVDNPDLTYEQRLDALRASNKAAAQQHPIADVAGNVTGALLPNPITEGVGVAGKAAEAVAPAAKTAIRVLTPVAQGAAFGTASAVGDNESAAHGAKIGAMMGLPGAVLVATAKPLGTLAARLGVLNRNPIVNEMSKAESLGTEATKAAKQDFRTFLTGNKATSDLVNKAPGPQQIENLRLAVNDSRDALLKTWPGLKGDLEKIQAAIDSGKIDDVRKIQDETLAIMARTKNGQAMAPKFQEFVNLNKAQKALDVVTSGSHGSGGNSMVFSRPLEMATAGNPRAMFLAAKEALTGNRPIAHMGAIGMGLASKLPRQLDIEAAKLAHAVATKDQDAIQKVAGELINKGVTRATVNQTLKNWGAKPLDDEEDKPISLNPDAK